MSKKAILAILLSLSLSSQADDTSQMTVTAHINNKPATPIVVVEISRAEGNDLNFIEAIAFGCAYGAKDSIATQNRKPKPGELDRIYMQCMKDSGGMF